MARLPQYRIIKKNGKFIPQKREYLILWISLFVPLNFRIMAFDTLDDAKKFIDKQNLVTEDIRVLKGDGVICYRENIVSPTGSQSLK